VAPQRLSAAPLADLCSKSAGRLRSLASMRTRSFPPRWASIYLAFFATAGALYAFYTGVSVAGDPASTMRTVRLLVAVLGLLSALVVAWSAGRAWTGRQHSNGS
jgi:hypothetical protein